MNEMQLFREQFGLIDITPDELLGQNLYLKMEGMNDIEMQTFENALVMDARKHGMAVGPVRNSIKAAKKTIRESRQSDTEVNTAIQLERTDKGVPACTIENFYRIMREDERFKSVRLNEFTHNIEIGSEKLTDTVNDSLLHYIEYEYGIYSVPKFLSALNEYASDHSYHPVRELIESFEWDGIERVPYLLTTWMDCDDTAYTREVSRLIFAGGIHRIYNPGCKFDDVPVLIGTRQGEGKSTFVRWLAMEDKYHTEVFEFDGQKGIEAIEGAWICEVSELLALTRKKDVEASKAYLSRLSDKYRKPYDRFTSNVPRECIFIGTTNENQFLIDKTGNRRFYPIRVNSNGYELFNREEECKEYIRQCWAEAKALFDQGKLSPFANAALYEDYREARELSEQDDWRDPVIQAWLSNKDRCSINEVWLQALQLERERQLRDSKDIAQILQKCGFMPTGNNFRDSTGRCSKEYKLIHKP